MNIGMITGRGTAQAEGDWRLPMFLSGTEEMTEEAVGRLFGARLTLSPQRTTAANHLWVTCDAKTMLRYRVNEGWNPKPGLRGRQPKRNLRCCLRGGVGLTFLAGCKKDGEHKAAPPGARIGREK